MNKKTNFHFELVEILLASTSWFQIGADGSPVEEKKKKNTKHIKYNILVCSMRK